MFQHDAVLTVHDTGDGNAHRRHRSGLDATGRDVERLLRGAAVDGRRDGVQRQCQRLRDHLHGAPERTPERGADLGSGILRWQPPEAEQAEQRFRAVVAAVVRDLAEPHAVDAARQRRERDHQLVGHEAGRHGGVVKARVAPPASAFQPRQQRRRQQGRMHQRIGRGGDHVLARFEEAADLLEELGTLRAAALDVVGQRVGGHEADAVGWQAQQGLHVACRQHAASRLAAQITGVAPGLVGTVHPHPDEFERGVLQDAPQREAAGVAGAALDDRVAFQAGTFNAARGRAGTALAGTAAGRATGRSARG